MSNNIYDILKKIENLEGPRQTLTEGKKAKPDYIDIDQDGNKKEPMKKAAKDKAKSGMAEAVARVEQQLSEKYSGYKKSLEENAVEESGLQAYLGKKKYGEQGMKALQQAGREGASKEKMAIIRARHDKMDEGFDDNYGSPDIDRVMSRQGSEDFSKKSERQRELDAVERIGAMRHDEREQQKYKDRTAPGVINKVKDYFNYDKPNPAYGPKFRDDAGTEYDYPYGNPKRKDYSKRYGRVEDPYAEFGDKFPVKEGEYNEDMLSPKQQKIARMAGDPKKIDANDLKALRAGKKKKAEGNAFSGALDAARDAGKDKFKVGSKEYQVQEDDTDFLDGVDDRGNPRLSPAGAAKVQNHPKYDPNRSANAQYSDHFDQRGYQRMTHDQAVEVGKNPKYNPNLPANAQWDLLNKPGSTTAMKEGELSAKEKWMNPDNTFKNPKTDAEWARIHKSRRDYEADLAKDGIKPPPFHLKSDDDAALRKARSQDQTDRDADRGTLNRLGNYGSRLFFGSDIPVNEGGKSMREGWEEMQKYLEKKKGPESKGGAGKKAGTRYGGSAQKDDDEDTDGEGKPVEKKKGRPKGTGGGAKFSFKKPKD